MPKPVTVYSTSYCPYCIRVKNLLKKKGVAFTEVDVTNDEALREDMVRKAGGKRTVPQVFIGEKHVGGSDDLHALEAAGKLDDLLNN